MKICCVKTESIPPAIKAETGAFHIPYSGLIKSESIVWKERQEAEVDENYQQIIPYVLLKSSEGKFACYQRHGNEKRLHGKWSCGVGGHIDEGDRAASFEKTVENGMYRELGEELENFDTAKVELTYLGVINEVESEVGKVHLGLVSVATCNAGYVPIAASELKDMEWKTSVEIEKMEKELWTELAFRLLQQKE